MRDDHFLGQKFVNFFFSFFWKFKTSKRNSEINWPLCIIKFFVLYLPNFFFRVQKLKFHGEDQSVLGDTLLRFAAIGIFAYSTFNIVVGALSVHRDPKNLLILATGGISIIQVIVKFSFSEKATKIWSYHPLDFSKRQIKWVITLNFYGLLRKAEL